MEHVRYLRGYYRKAKTLRDELDFTRERRNLEEFRRNFAEDDTVHFPRPWPAFSSRRVLTMERMQGILVSQTPALQADNIDRDGFARRGANVYLEMIFRDGFYHADPHPGNLMFLPGAVVGVLDCGMVQRLHDGLREDIEGALLALAQGDAEALTDSVWHLGTPPPTGRREPLMAELVEFVAEYTGQSLNELHLSAALTRLFDLLHRNHVFLPPMVEGGTRHVQNVGGGG